MHVYIYIYIYVCVCLVVYMFIICPSRRPSKRRASPRSRGGAAWGAMDAPAPPPKGRFMKYKSLYHSSSISISCSSSSSSSSSGSVTITL